MRKRILLFYLVAITLFARAQQSAGAEASERALAMACIAGNAQAIQSAAMELAKTAAYGADKLEYASNLLSSVEVNGILFTGGKGDTYPVLILQYLKNMRTDVRVVHVDWMSDASYFQNLQASTGIEKTGSPGLRELSEKAPVYISLAAKKELMNDLESDLYCTGLAFKCSSSPLANVKVMYKEWWQRCGKGYMSSGYSLNANYLLPLAILADYAKEIGNSTEYNSIKQKYAEIARSVGEKEQLPAIK